MIKEKKEKMKEIMERFQDKKEALREWIEEKKEAIKDWVEKKKEERDGDDEGRRPRPHFKHAIVGKVTVSEVSCEDQGPYLVRYGSRKDDREDKEEGEVEGRDGKSKRRPRKP